MTGFPSAVALHQGEAAIVGCEDEAVSVQVFSHLFGAGEFLEVVGESLDFPRAAVGFFAEVGVGIFAPALDLSGGEKPEVGLSVSVLCPSWKLAWTWGLSSAPTAFSSSSSAP